MKTTLGRSLRLPRPESCCLLDAHVVDVRTDRAESDRDDVAGGADPATNGNVSSGSLLLQYAAKIWASAGS